MMKIIRSIVGTLAVIFSIQPLATWATNSGDRQDSKDAKKITIFDLSRSGKESAGPPTCHEPV